MISLLFQTRLFSDNALLLVALSRPVLSDFAPSGHWFAAMLVRTRGRDVGLPIVLYPITIPA